MTSLRKTALTAVALASSLAACSSGSSTPAALGTQTGPHKYSSTSFVVPFDVVPPTWLTPVPTLVQPNFVTWEAPLAAGANYEPAAVRFLVPVSVYRPDSKDPTAPPQDYFTYLSGQTSSGAHFTARRKMTVGGRQATIVTATSDKSLDGSLGCPMPTTAARDCFGLQPDLALRIAVVDMGDKTLLTWLKMGKDTPASEMTSEVKSFEGMLASIRFSDRGVLPATTRTS